MLPFLAPCEQREKRHFPCASVQFGYPRVKHSSRRKSKDIAKPFGRLFENILCYIRTENNESVFAILEVRPQNVAQFVQILAKRQLT